MNTKVIVIVAVIASIITLVGALFAMIPQDEVQPTDEVKTLFSEIDKDIKSLVDNEDLDFTTTTSNLVLQYNDNLDRIIDLVAERNNIIIPDDHRKDLKHIIIAEHLSEMNRQKLVSQIPEDAITETIILNSVSKQGFEIPRVFATENPYPISSFHQVTIDITGGEGEDSVAKPYNINGENELAELETSYNSTYTIYTMTFTDEDHPVPVFDEFWDYWRAIIYERTTDIESFEVVDDTIYFQGLWDNDRTFAEFFGQHGNAGRPYESDVTIYTSNVWNHSMDTKNNNPDMESTIYSP